MKRLSAPVDPRQNTYMRSTIVFFLAAAICPAQQGSTTHRGHVDSGYKMTPMPAPKLMTGIGTSPLRITTNSPEAQAYFSQGMALLHCFWEFEAWRAFKEAARLDPDAPMPYWGILRAVSQFPAMEDERADAAAKLKKLMDRASDHEKYYLREFQHDANLHEEPPNFKEQLVEKYPDDVDAQAFLGLSLSRGYDVHDQPNPGQVAAYMVLENLLTGHPDNAAANHYLIHVLEAGPHPERALQAADALAKLAPASGHMVHMPGHIYYRIGDYERARESFLAAMKVEEEYMRREHVNVIDNWNYPHNISYLIAVDVETGRYREALQLADKLDGLPVITGRAIANPRHAVTVGATTARLQSRFGHWDEVIKHPVIIGDEELAGAPARTYRGAILAYARGMRAIDAKDFAAASRESDALDAIQWRLKNGHFDVKDNGFPDSVLNLVASYSLDLRGNLECAMGHLDEGMKLLEESAENARAQIGYSEPPTYGRPEQESIGYAYLRAKNFGKAREAFEKELKERPKSGHALYAIALSYEESGDNQAARKAYGEFLASWHNADPDLPMMQNAHLQLR
jgi:tetratricopeptide (TPR) repeat protein